MENTISFNTKFGWISASETNNKITKVQFGRKKNSGIKTKNLRNLEKKILSFFKGKIDKLDIKIFSKGNLIQKRIWQELKQIKNILIIGLMTINPKGLSSKENLKLFIKCREIADYLKLSECSMGMSHDWNEAIEAGTTWLRIGSLIFGKR